MQLIIVRHGATQHNKGHIVSGGSSNPELNILGINSAKKASQYIDVKQINKVFTSPLKRAYETAKILTKNQVNINVDKHLLEMKFGSWEGENGPDLKLKYPDAFDPDNMMNNKYTKYAQNSESYKDVENRCQDFLHYLKINNSRQTIMLVCHGFLIRAFIANLFNVRATQIGLVKNLSFTEIYLNERKNFQPEIKSFNANKPQYFAVRN